MVTVAAGQGFAGKPRPALVVQDDSFALLSTTVVLLFTTHHGADPLLRPEYVPTSSNGLLETSRLMIHAPTTVRLEDVGKHIGVLTPAEMADIDERLLLLLGIGRVNR